ncbi:MAG: methyltransferase domain-containing protein [Clostridia bacterium]|nr:methyltransferase domain-containing protein [Clostridia bacterium]
MTGHHELRCTVHPFGSLAPLRFVVVCSFHRGQLLLSYHSGHQSWETQGGHIEEGETPEDAARRELYEESGVSDAQLVPVCDYYAYDQEGASNGRVYAALVRRLGTLPDSEMSMVRLFDTLPDNLTYPLVTPVLFREAAKRTGGRSTDPRTEISAENPVRTLTWYRENAEKFIAGTADADLTPLYTAFLAYVPAGGRILDLGCGAGAASLHFKRLGYDVMAVDGCREMCEYTRRRVGCSVRCLRFEELDFMDEFDGVWACASLLHVPRDTLPPVLRLVRRALKDNGALYASFKYGGTERVSDGRFFCDFTLDTLRTLMDETGGFREIALKTTYDVRPGRGDERWVNMICLACPGQNRPEKRLPC